MLMRLAPATALTLLLAACQATGGGDPHPTGHGFRNELTLAIGEFNEAEEEGARFGVDYERRSPDGWGWLSEKWGFGVMSDFYTNPLESFLLAGQLVYHPVEPVSFIVAGGFNDNVDGDNELDTWLVRLGSRYTFELAPNVGWGPEIFYDILEQGARRGVLALTLTYRF